MSAYTIATLWLIAKVLVGTGVFIAVLAVGQLLDGRAAGLMVTFPALNGMGLLAAADLDRVANELFPIIVLNGLLCAACIWAYRRLPLVRSNAAVRTALPYLALLIWAAALIPVLRLGETVASAWMVTLGYALLTVAIGAAAYFVPDASPPDRATGAIAAGRRPFWQVNRGRIALFTGSLVALLIAAEAWQAALGALSALPLVPLFGLAGIAEERPDRLDEMKDTILFGPLLAMIFVLLLWRYLGHVGTQASGWQLTLYSGAACLLGWTACVVIIVAASVAWRRRWKARAT